MILGTFTEFHNHHDLWKYFHHPQKKAVPLSSHSPFLPEATLHQLSVSADLLL